MRGTIAKGIQHDGWILSDGGKLVARPSARSNSGNHRFKGVVNEYQEMLCSFEILSLFGRKKKKDDNRNNNYEEDLFQEEEMPNYLRDNIQLFDELYGQRVTTIRETVYSLSNNIVELGNIYIILEKVEKSDAKLKYFINKFDPTKDRTEYGIPTDTKSIYKGQIDIVHHFCKHLASPVNSFRHDQLSAIIEALGPKVIEKCGNKTVVREKPPSDIMVYWPTGSGKSMCFQIPGLISKGVTVIISPLLALMIDQVLGVKRRIGLSPPLKKTKTKNIENEILGGIVHDYTQENKKKRKRRIEADKGSSDSSTDSEKEIIRTKYGIKVNYKVIKRRRQAEEKEYELKAKNRKDSRGMNNVVIEISGRTGTKNNIQILDQLAKGNDIGVKLIYTTPESFLFMLHLWAKAKEQGLLSRIVVDEAHCVIDWGASFRPFYSLLGEAFSSHFKGVPITALTGTASPSTRRHIYNLIFAPRPPPTVYAMSTDRPNLAYFVSQAKDNAHKLDIIIKLLRERYQGKVGIIYCMYVGETEKVAKRLRDEGFMCCKFTSQTNTKVKTLNKWINEKIPIMVATIAFGMGIDKENVRFIIHLELPKTVEMYGETTGRAGRDGLRSECVTLYTMTDVSKRVLLGNDLTKKPLLRYREITGFVRMFKFCMNRQECRRVLMARYYDDEEVVKPCYMSYTKSQLGFPVLVHRRAKFGAQTESQIFTSKASNGSTCKLELCDNCLIIIKKEKQRLRRYYAERLKCIEDDIEKEKEMRYWILTGSIFKASSLPLSLAIPKYFLKKRNKCLLKLQAVKGVLAERKYVDTTNLGPLFSLSTFGTHAKVFMYNYISKAAEVFSRNSDVGSMNFKDVKTKLMEECGIKEDFAYHLLVFALVSQVFEYELTEQALNAQNSRSLKLIAGSRLPFLLAENALGYNILNSVDKTSIMQFPSCFYEDGFPKTVVAKKETKCGVELCVLTYPTLLSGPITMWRSEQGLITKGFVKSFKLDEIKDMTGKDLKIPVIGQSQEGSDKAVVLYGCQPIPPKAGSRKSAIKYVEEWNVGDTPNNSDNESQSSSSDDSKSGNHNDKEDNKEDDKESNKENNKESNKEAEKESEKKSEKEDDKESDNVQIDKIQMFMQMKEALCSEEKTPQTPQKTEPKAKNTPKGEQTNKVKGAIRCKISGINTLDGEWPIDGIYGVAVDWSQFNTKNGVDSLSDAIMGLTDMKYMCKFTDYGWSDVSWEYMADVPYNELYDFKYLLMKTFKTLPEFILTFAGMDQYDSHNLLQLLMSGKLCGYPSELFFNAWTISQQVSKIMYSEYVKVQAPWFELLLDLRKAQSEIKTAQEKRTYKSVKNMFEKRELRVVSVSVKPFMVMVVCKKMYAIVHIPIELNVERFVLFGNVIRDRALVDFILLHHFNCCPLIYSLIRKIPKSTAR